MRFSYRTVSCIAAVMAVLTLASCGNRKEERSPENFTPQQLYRSGEVQIERNRYARAAKRFEEVERVYPYSSWTRRAILQAAYAYNLARQYDQSREAAQRFLRFYPGDEDAAYAQYLVAMSYYSQVDLKGQDRTNAIKALQELNRVTSGYGTSGFAQSAELAMDVVVDRLAEKEMEVGRFYLKGQHYTAAIKRFQNVVDNTFLDAVDIIEERPIEESGTPRVTLSQVYTRTTSHVPEALHRLVEAYLSLGLVEEAQESASILAYNFNSTVWYEESYSLLQQVGADVPQRSGGTGFFNRFYRQSLRGEWI